MTPLPDDHPLMRVWEEYKQTEGYANTIHWAVHPQHTEGSLWAAFEAGWNSALFVAGDYDKARELTPGLVTRLQEQVYSTWGEGMKRDLERVAELRLRLKGMNTLRGRIRTLFLGVGRV